MHTNVNNPRRLCAAAAGLHHRRIGSARRHGQHLAASRSLVSQWGGMTFLIPYFLFVILIASTGVIGEFALGRAGGAGPVGSFGMCTEARFGKRKPGELVGYIPVLGSLALAIGYTCVMGWIFKYTFLAFDGGLSPWARIWMRSSAASMPLPARGAQMSGSWSQLR